MQTNIRRVLFLDRDGIINVDKHFVSRQDDVIFVDGLFQMCKYFTERDYEIVIITNQSGIGRGLFSEKDLQILMTFIFEKFKLEGIEILGYFYCPHKPSDLCKCRKPLPGMFKRAMQKFDLLPTNCISVGDRETDILAAVHAGIQHNYLLVNNPLNFEHVTGPTQVKTLHEIVEIHRRVHS